MIEGLHFGSISGASVALLSPLVSDAADSGGGGDDDVIAASILDRQANEIVALAEAAIARLNLDDLPVPVVLGGGVLAAGNVHFLRRSKRNSAGGAHSPRYCSCGTVPSSVQRPSPSKRLARSARSRFLHSPRGPGHLPNWMTQRDEATG